MWRKTKTRRDRCNWAIESYGVDPDIELDNTPGSLIDGHALQFERAVEEVMKMICANPPRLAKRSAAHAAGAGADGTVGGNSASQKTARRHSWDRTLTEPAS